LTENQLHWLLPDRSACLYADSTIDCLTVDPSEKNRQTL